MTVRGHLEPTPGLQARLSLYTYVYDIRVVEVLQTEGESRAVSIVAE